jgi:glycosyltransferase involved in cell wall biosynthesis
VDYVVYNATSDTDDGKRIRSVARHRAWWMIRYLFTAREPAVFVMSDRLAVWMLTALLAMFRGTRIGLRLRNENIIRWQRVSWRRWCCRFVCRRVAMIIAVNRELADAASALGAPAERVYHLPGFLPPLENTSDRSSVAPAVWKFLDNHEPRIAANGKIRYLAGSDVYGFDQLVELAGALKSDYPNLGIVICFSVDDCSEREALAALMKRAEALGVTDLVHFETFNGLFVPVLAACDVFVRPTTSDGDANSVREALALGVPTVASDIVERPSGTLTYACGDLADFARAVRDALAQGARTTRPDTPQLSRADQDRVATYIQALADLAAGTPPMPTAASRAQ